MEYKPSIMMLMLYYIVNFYIWKCSHPKFGLDKHDTVSLRSQTGCHKVVEVDAINSKSKGHNGLIRVGNSQKCL